MSHKISSLPTSASLIRMIKRPLIALFALITVSGSAQDIIFNVKSYKGGYNISCNGSSDGAIDATIVGGVPPYTYSWSNGATTQDLTSLAAGVYTLTVTDALGSTKSKSATLFEPDLLDVVITTSLYDGGYQISKQGANDGFINTDVKGGATPYKYLWNTGSQKANLDKLVAGTYSVTVTDQNGCSVVKTVTLLEPTPITITLSATTYGAYNTRCFESKDGNINLTASGGMPPYRYSWNYGSFDEDLTNVPAGTYKVLVIDANKATAEASITLTEPAKLEVGLTASTYGNYNISCPSCFNGSITTTVTGGTPPFTYLWKGNGSANGQTTQNLSGLGQGNYEVTITDQNGCKTEGRIFLTEPPSTGWDKSGNIGTTTDFLGTTNNVPLVFKTNNTEQFRVAENGNVGIGTASPNFKLHVNGTANVSGDVISEGSLFFAGDKKISYVLGTSSTPSIFAFGAAPRPPSPCFTAPIIGPLPTSNQFSGLIESYDMLTTTNNVMTMGFDGTNGIIDLSGPLSTKLMINYNCAHDVEVSTGSLGGNVSIGAGNGGNINILGGLNGDMKIGYGSNTGKINIASGNNSGDVGISTGTASKTGVGIDSPFAKMEIFNDDATPITACISRQESHTFTRRIIIEPKLNGSDYNYLTQPGDIGMFWTDGRPENATTSTGFVLGRWGGAGTDYPFCGMRMTKEGFIGIGVAQPGAMVDINNGEYGGGPGVRNPIGLKITSTYSVNPEIAVGVLCQMGDNTNKTISTGKTDGTTYTENFVVFADGHVRARDIRITLQSPFTHPDYVFEKDHKLMKIEELEAYVKKHKHLPNIPSAADVKANEGINLGEMSEKQLEKIEELTLYIIEMNKKLDELENTVRKQNEEIQSFKNK